MKARITIFSALLLLTIVAPAALAQRGLGDQGGTIIVGHVPTQGGTVLARAFTAAYLTTPGNVTIGKVKTATVQTTDGLIQGMRVSVSNLTPGSEFALVIDGTLVGTATAEANGTLKMRFLDPVKPGGRALAIPEAIKPIATAHIVQLFEVSGQRLIAAGDFTINGGGR